MANDLATLFPHDPAKEACAARLRDLLFGLPPAEDGTPRQSYLLLDAAASPEIATYAEAFPEPATCLFDGAAYDELAEVAPWLIAITPYGDAFDWFLESGWGQNWGVFVQTTLPLARLKTRLKSHLYVSSDDEARMFFKFYRPRTLRDYLPVFEPEQLRAFFFKLDAYLIEGATPAEVLQLSLAGDDTLMRQSIALQPAA